MIAIIDYGMGNLRSVQKALENVGGKTCIVAAPDGIMKADKLVLPGVGAMKPAMDKLQASGLDVAIKLFAASGKPFLGICLGFQLLFDESSEGGSVKGLGMLPGRVERFPDTVKVPQMGWNNLKIVQPGCPMYRGVGDGRHVYFCHSYYAAPKDQAVIATTTEHGIAYASSVCKGNIWGVQFHPEKSQAAGLRILENFVQC